MDSVGSHKKTHRLTDILQCGRVISLRHSLTYSAAIPMTAIEARKIKVKQTAILKDSECYAHSRCIIWYLNLFIVRDNAAKWYYTLKH